MDLKIIIDNELERLTGRLSKMTYDRIPKVKRPELILNQYFYLGDLEKNIVIVMLDSSIIQDDNLLYLHQTAKDLYYPDTNVIHLKE